MPCTGFPPPCTYKDEPCRAPGARSQMVSLLPSGGIEEATPHKIHHLCEDLVAFLCSWVDASTSNATVRSYTAWPLIAQALARRLTEPSGAIRSPARIRSRNVARCSSSSDMA